MLGLDEREYELTAGMCVIADENGVESIAGIMGGEHSGCDEKHHRCAHRIRAVEPDRHRQRQAASSASSRMRVTVSSAASIPNSWCRGWSWRRRWWWSSVVASLPRTRSWGYEGYTPRRVSFPLAEVRRLTGLDVPRAESLSILERLGFAPRGRG